MQPPVQFKPVRVTMRVRLRCFPLTWPACTCDYDPCRAARLPRGDAAGLQLLLLLPPPLLACRCVTVTSLRYDQCRHAHVSLCCSTAWLPYAVGTVSVMTCSIAPARATRHPFNRLSLPRAITCPLPHPFAVYLRSCSCRVQRRRAQLQPCLPSAHCAALWSRGQLLLCK
jgi:hypothetical protein